MNLSFRTNTLNSYTSKQINKKLQINKSLHRNIWLKVTQNRHKQLKTQLPQKETDFCV